LILTLIVTLILIFSLTGLDRTRVARRPAGATHVTSASVTVPGVTTLEEPRDVAAVRRGRGYRRAGMTVVLLIVLAGLVGLLGIRSTTDTSSGGGYVLAVHHAQVTRAGIAVPLHIRVEHPGGFSRPVRISLSAALMERFDFQNFYPNPSKETASGAYLYYEFDPPPGDVFEVSLDARTAPDQNGSAGHYEIRLLDGTRPLASVGFRMWVVP
jgi:hypothetical protein